MGAATLSPAVVIVPRRRPRVGALGVAVAAWLAGCLAVGAWVRLETIEAGYAISAQGRERARLLQEGRKLELEMARLSALERVHAIASGRLRMRFPSSEEVVKLP